MAGSTFLALTNKLLRRLNEVELTDSTFASARNVGAAAKDCIIAAIAEINSSEYQWEWNTNTETVNVVLGQVVYQFPTDDTVPDWNTFTLTASDDNPPQTMKYLTSEEYYKYYRQNDLQQTDEITGAGSGWPKFMFPVPGGFGVSPVPDKAYTMTYSYYKVPPELVLSTDTTNIPTVWDYVILNMALKHYSMYKDNTEQAGFWVNESNKSFSKMVNSLVNRDDYVWSNMSNFGGQKWSSTNYQWYKV